MRAALVLLVLVLASMPGCVEEPLDLEASLIRFYDAHCLGNVDEAFVFVADPFYAGTEGPVGHDERRKQFAAQPQRERTDCSAVERFDFGNMRTLAPSDVEGMFNVSIDREIPGYEPGAEDVYVLVPARPNPGSDDPLQGFWRPADQHWEFVAAFEA